MNTTLTILRRLTTAAVGAGAVAIDALAMGAPANAETLPALLRDQPGRVRRRRGARRVQHRAARRGWDRDEICKVYDAAGKLLGTAYHQNYGDYKTHQIEQVTPPPVLSNR